ncbi:MAG: Uncharacterised protein [Alphaproteobacteria bacterium]|nr:MAG: Uncharacterised protein [Alphaproteobacteria bacterium]
MRFGKYYGAFSGLVVYRASLLAAGKGRAGRRLPGLKKAQREWCYHSRSRRDFALLLLTADFSHTHCDENSLGSSLAVSRNTLKTIIREAEALHIAKLAQGRRIVICRQFVADYMTSYLSEWTLMESPTSKELAVAFKQMAKKFDPMSVMQAQERALQMSVTSRAETVNANRKRRLTERKTTGPMDLSSWVVSNSFNRDLLLLLMSAGIEERPLNIADIMRRLHVSRNAVKASLKIGIDSGFVEKSPRGFKAEKTALIGYLDWHGEVFSAYSDETLSAFSVFYDSLASHEIK